MEGHNPRKKDNRIWKITGAAALAVILIGLVAVGVKMSKQGQPEPEDAQTVADMGDGTGEGEGAGGGVAAVPELGTAGDDGGMEPEEELPEYIQALMDMGVPVPEKKVDFEDLKEKVNGDIYAWIYIPDSKVDYPVVQHPSDDLYYLKYNLDGSYGYPGCIYTERYNKKDFRDPVTVIYGHNMKNGTMFAGLHNYEDMGYFREHPYVYIYTPEKMLVYQIFASYEYTNEHLLYGHNYFASSEFQGYIDDVMGYRSMNCNRAEDVEIGLSDHILVLSTCMANKPDNRYLVQGVLLNEG